MRSALPLLHAFVAGVCARAVPEAIDAGGAAFLAVVAVVSLIQAVRALPARGGAA